MFETNYLLTLWLKTVPDNTVIFLRIMICTSLLNAVANPLIIANQATGKVRKYQAICGTLLLMILPISYVCLLLGYPAYAGFVVHFVIEYWFSVKGIWFRMAPIMSWLKIKMEYILNYGMHKHSII